jgi:hypothetical protein
VLAKGTEFRYGHRAWAVMPGEMMEICMECASIVGQADKVCKGCSKAKPLAEFVNNGITPDKKHPFCNTCRKAALSAGWEKRRQAAQARMTDIADTKMETHTVTVIDEEEWWDLFHVAVSGCAVQLQQIDAIHGKDRLEAHAKKVKLKTAFERLHAAIVAMWGEPA